MYLGLLMNMGRPEYKAYTTFTQPRKNPAHATRSQGRAGMVCACIHTTGFRFWSLLIGMVSGQGYVGAIVISSSENGCKEIDYLQLVFLHSRADRSRQRLLRSQKRLNDLRRRLWSRKLLLMILLIISSPCIISTTNIRPRDVWIIPK